MADEAKETPDVDALFPPSQQRDVDELFPPSVEQNRQRAALGASPIQDYIFSRDHVSAARILNHFGVGFKDAWGAEPLGLSGESTKYLRDRGWFNDYANGEASIAKAANESLFRSAAWSFDAAYRGSAAVFRGAQEAVAETGADLGYKQLGRDIAAIPEAFQGTPHPTGVPHVAVEVPLGERLTLRARALKVIGAGEDGWSGAKVEEKPPVRAAEPVSETPAAVTSAIEKALSDAKPEAVAEVPAATPQPDVHGTARGIAPDLFYKYDDIQKQRETLSGQISEVSAMRATTEAQAKEIADLRSKLETRLNETEAQAREIAPAVKEAYAEAGKASPAEEPVKPVIVPEEPVSAPKAAEPTTPAKPIEDQRAFIQNDVAQKLVAAGRSETEAQAAAAIDAAYWETRAARFNGTKGSAEEMYLREAPEILGPGMRSDVHAPRAKATHANISLTQFIAQRGGIIDNDPMIADVRSVIGKKNKTIPGMGNLIRKDGIPLDHLREAAVEAGYLSEDGGQKTTVRSLLDALRDEDKGRKVYARGEEPVAKFDADANRADIEHALDTGLRDVGIDPKGVQETIKARAVEIVEKEGGDPIAAYEKAEAEAGMFQRDLFDKQAELFDAGDKNAPVSAAGKMEEPPTKLAGAPQDFTTAEHKAIEDFGQKIEGARKDTFAGFRDALSEKLDVLAEPLSKSFPQPNYEKLAADGVNKRSLAYIAIMRDMIPNRPRKPYKAKQWGAQVETLRDFSRMLLDGDVDTATLDSRMKDNYSLKTLPLTAEAIDDVAPSDLPRAAQYRINSGSYSMLNGQRYSPSKSFWFIESPEGRSSFRNPLSNDPANPYTYRETPAEVVALAKQIIPLELEKKAEAPTGERSKYTEVNLYRDRTTGGVYLGFKVRSTVIRLKAGFEDVKAAREYLQENRDGLQANIDAMREGPNERGTENRPRSGESLREGDVSPQSFDNTFGFRGVQFGNYVEEGRRQGDLNRAFDALMDLSDVLGVPPKALSLDGQLGLAFGARGTGGKRAAAAHYEPDQVVINLTKGSGPGSLAHEWLHAADNYFARQDVGKDRSSVYISANHRDSGLVRDEVYQAWKNVENTIQSGGFAERAAKFDEARSKPYWNTTIEKAARSFEKYVIDRLAEKGAVNDYLANIDTAGGAYPTSHEMQSLGIRAAYDRLFDTIETRNTDRGVEMFQEGDIKRGRIRLRETGVNTITLLKDANASTFIHEKGHDYLHRLLRDAAEKDAPETIKADRDTVLKWLGVEKPEDIKTSHHERFARGFENYIMEGRAPSRALARVFEQFRQWLLRIYSEASRLKADINDDVRGVFDRMLAVNPEEVVIAPDKTPERMAASHEAKAGEIPAPQGAGAAGEIRAERDKMASRLSPEEQDARLAEIAAGLEGRAPGGSEPLRDGNAAEPTAGGSRLGEEPGAVGKGGSEASPEASAVVPAKSAGVKTEIPTEPHAPFAASSDVADKAGNIRLDLLNTPDDVKNVIRRVADENEGFQSVRGPVTDIQVAELADAMGMDATYLSTRKLGEAWTAPQIVALRKLLIQSATNVRDLMKKAATGDEAALAAYAEAKTRHIMIQERVSSVTAEAGRALRAFQGKFTGVQDAKALGEFLKKETGQTLFQLQREAQLGMSLETPSQVSKFIHDSQKATFPQMIQEFWINALLSGPITHVKNIIGNAAVAVLNVGESAVTAGVGRIREAFGHEGERVRLGEARASLFGLVQGAQDGAKAAVYAFKHDDQYTRAQTIEQPKYQAIPSKRVVVAKYEQGSPEYKARLESIATARAHAERLTGERLTARVEELRTNPTPDMVLEASEKAYEIGGRQIRLPGRLLTAEDELFKTIAYRQKINELAYRQAAKEELSGDAFNSRMAQLTLDPSEAMMTEAAKHADYQTFTNALGKTGIALQQFSNSHVLAKMVVPFIRTPLNLLKYANERTPIGLFSKEVRANLSGVNGKIAQDTQIARIAVGTSLGVWMMHLANEGTITGAGPSDSKEKAVKMLSGWRPYSIRIGDTYYSYAWLDPFSTIMGISADLADGIKNGLDEDGPETSKVVSSLFASISKNILSKSSLRGTSDLLNAATDPDRWGPRYIQNLVGSLVPSVIAQQAKAHDEYQREARTVLDTIKSRLPGLRQDLKPRRDIWGEPMDAGDNLGPDSFSPIAMARLTKDPATQALLDAEVFPSRPTRKIRGVDLTDQQYDDYSRIAGRMAKMRVNAMVSNPGFSQAPQEIRQELLTKAVSGSREAARSLVMMQNPSIIRDAIEAKALH